MVSDVADTLHDSWQKIRTADLDLMRSNLVSFTVDLSGMISPNVADSTT